MVGFGYSGLCIFWLLFTGLKPLCWLLIAYGSFVHLFKGWHGLVVSLEQVLVLSLLCWMAYWCDLALCVVWFRFRLLRRHLALWPAEVGRVYRLGMDLFTLLSTSVAEIGFRWDHLRMVWSRLGLPLLGNFGWPCPAFQGFCS